MASGIAGADRLPSGDYSVAHRAPPPIPSIVYSNTSTSSPPPQLLHEAGKPGHVSESASVRSTYSERRRGSLGSLLRRTSSHNSQLHQKQNSSSSDIPPVPAVPTTRIAQAHQAAAASQSGRGSTSSNHNRKISGEGRTMLRKSSKMKAAAEKERLENERLARATAPPPRLPSHNPLPGIGTFGGDNANNNSANAANNQAANFSRPGYDMPPSTGFNSSSSPAYATRGTPPTSSPGKTNGEYVGESVERHESMTHRGRYSYASSTVPVNVSSPRRIRRRKDPTPFK